MPLPLVKHHAYELCRPFLLLYLLLLKKLFYIVPLFALVQSKSEANFLSRVIAGNNILNALFMVAAAIMAIALLGAGMSIAQLFLFTAVLNIIVSIILFKREPAFFNRLFILVGLRASDNQS